MVSSLKNLCVLPSVLAFSFHPDIKKQIFSPSSIELFNNRSKREQWNDALQNVISEVFRDFSTVFGKAIKRCFFYLVGSEMLRFANYLQSSFEIPIEFTKEFINISFFTSKLSIDEEKAAKILVMDPSLSNFQQYKISCYYSFRDLAHSSWQKLRENDPAFQATLNKHNRRSLEVEWNKYFEMQNKSSLLIAELDSFSSDFHTNVLIYAEEDSTVGSVKCFLPQFKRIISVNDSVSDKSELVFASYVKNISEYFDACILSNVFFSRYFIVHRDIIILLVKTVEKENMASFLNRYKLVYGFLKCLLIWPFQDLFLNFADSIFHILSEESFYRLLHHIIDLIQDPVLGDTYNYQHLLTEFWMRSPLYLKKFVHGVESVQVDFRFCFIQPFNSIDETISYYKQVYFPEAFLLLSPTKHLRWFLLQKAFMIKNVSVLNRKIFRLILESATQQEKDKILYKQGSGTIINLLHSTDFTLADFFIKCLTPNADTQREFIKRVTVDYFAYYAKSNLIFNIANQFLNFFFNSDEVIIVKREILPEIFENCHTAFQFLISKCMFNHFNNVCKFFNMTDEEIGERKANGIFKEIFRNALPDFAFDISREIIDKMFYKNILKICSKNIYRVAEFISIFKVFCKDMEEENIFKSEEREKLCSSFLDEIMFLLPNKKQKKLLELLD